MPKPLVRWSFSQYSNYCTCPHRWHKENYLYEYRMPDGTAAAFGTRAHDALEHYVQSGGDIALAEEFTPFQRWGDFVLRLKGDIHCELEMAITRDFEPCSWDDPNAWCRYKGDVVNIRGSKGVVLDYKTGKRYPKEAQLRLGALLVFIYFPKVETVNAGFIWLKNDQLDSPIQYMRANAATLWEPFLQGVSGMEDVVNNGDGPKYRNGLCKKWCPVVTCEFNGEYRAGKN